MQLRHGEFDGSDIVPERDDPRLGDQLRRMLSHIADGRWRTLENISYIADAPPASVSAQLRNLKKTRFRLKYGDHFVEKRYIGSGLWEYRVTPKPKRSDMPNALKEIFDMFAGDKEAQKPTTAEKMADKHYVSYGRTEFGLAVAKAGKFTSNKTTRRVLMFDGDRLHFLSVKIPKEKKGDVRRRFE